MKLVKEALEYLAKFAQGLEDKALEPVSQKVKDQIIKSYMNSCLPEPTEKQCVICLKTIVSRYERCDEERCRTLAYWLRKARIEEGRSLHPIDYISSARKTSSVEELPELIKNKNK